MSQTPQTPATREDILAAVRGFLKNDALGEDDDLFKSGLLDSLQIVTLVGFLEERFACSLNYDELTEENLGSLSRIAAMLLRKKTP